MPDVRFLQIHSLHGYSSALLNRDDSGLAKRIRYGGRVRTRISSQCLKRHWRVADSDYALQKIDGVAASVRSREIVSRRVIQPLRENGRHDPEVIKAIEATFQVAVYGDKGDTRSNRQPLLLGEPEIAYLAGEARKVAQENATDAKAAEAAAKAWVKNSKANMKELRANCALPGGIAAALFGRMVTSDVEANIDAAVHVAHAFTVHAEESESDYFTVVDDLQPADDEGADHIGETELTSGLFYGYTVLDRGMLLENLGGDTAVAGQVAERLVSLIATVSPGAKLGPTAPYGYARWMFVEGGDRQPRSLAEAFREPCKAEAGEATRKAQEYVTKLDAAYETGEARKLMSLDDAAMPGTDRVPSLKSLAEWSGTVMEEGRA